ncbi:hypothetical protein [Bacterioplanoides sp. SCSIO 12839]|uniref:hypothetical protein n=1 Tax=Bacterioplanoides sp. SCSIO 12839 TaxID=2829569 RepID=UPI002102D02A|nr:hypothetical protein [Bacterioplanoides sp. SCSIO 12839]UTW48693.1 hypothetical protein KFF03_01950 [Bacterioplanoides sp. SCSIO 12839]
MMKLSLSNLSLLLITPSLLLMSQAAQASSGHGTSDISSDSASSGWQADINLSYREENGPNMLGFLPTNSHQQQAGLSLNHADLSYQANLPTEFSGTQISDQQIGRIALSYHSDDVELSEAWIENRWNTNNLRLTTGKYLPRIGFLNHVHQHAQTLIQSPLMNKVYWGDELSEAGVRLEWLPKLGKRLMGIQLRHSLNILGGDHLNSNDNTLAALYQLEASQQLGALQVAALINGYYTNVSDRGLFLFDLSNNTHVHTNSGYTEFFDGDILHLGAGLKLSYASEFGDFNYQGEYAQRDEKGLLYSASSDLADLSMTSNGQYHQLWWTSPQQQWQLAMRYDYLYSDVEVANTSDNSLDDSRLNNNDATPKRISWMASWLFGAHNTNQNSSSQQRLQMIYSDGPDWDAYPAQLEIHLLQSFRF